MYSVYSIIISDAYNRPTYLLLHLFLLVATKCDAAVAIVPEICIYCQPPGEFCDCFSPELYADGLIYFCIPKSRSRKNAGKRKAV